MFGPKVRGGCIGGGCGGNDETIRRVTREKFVVRGNTTFRTVDSTTSYLPIAENRYINFII